MFAPSVGGWPTGGLPRVFDAHGQYRPVHALHLKARGGPLAPVSRAPPTNIEADRKRHV